MNCCCQRILIRIVTAILAAAALSACREIIAPEQLHPLHVWEIEVAGEFELSRLEVEVHLLDARTGRLLGCSGASQGMAPVDSNYIRYYIDADFVTPGNRRLFIEDIEYRDIEVWVIEDDSEPCPGPFVPGVDDVIGVSRPVPGDIFWDSPVLRFGRVRRLVIGI